MQNSSPPRNSIQALILAANLWLDEEGVSTSPASTYNEFAQVAESVFNRTMAERGLRAGVEQ